MYITQDLVGGDLDVHCDGYFVRLRLTDTNVCSVYVDGAVVTDFGDQYIDDGTVNYRMSRDANITRTVIEDTPTRVKIRVYAQERSAAQALLTNNLWCEIIFTIYPDRFTYDYRMAMSGTNALSTGFTTMGPMYIWHPATEGYSAYYEDVGSETLETGNAEHPSASYFYSSNAEATFQTILLDQFYPSGGSPFTQRTTASLGSGAGIIRYGLPNNPTLVEGIYYMKVMTIIDTTFREGSAKKYDTLADRTSFADQYQDPTLDLTPPSGATVSDMIIPEPVFFFVDGTLYSDGSHFYEPSGAIPAVKMEYDRERCRPAITIRDWPYNTGSVTNPVDHLLNHFKMDDNSASNILVATTGPSGSWHNVSDTSARSTSGDSVQEIGRGRNLNTQDGAAYGELAVGAGTVHDNEFLKSGSILVKLKPNFTFDAQNQQIFYLYQGLDNRIRAIYDATDDRFEFDVNWGGTNAVIFSPAFTNNFELQREMVLHFYWDSDKDFFGFAIDGQVVAFNTNTGTPTSSEPSVFVLNVYYDLSTNPGDYIFDEIKTFNEAILPYGANFIGNGYGLLKNIDDPHADLSWYFDGQAALGMGGTDLATTKNPTSSGGQFTTDASLIGSYGWDSNGTDGVLTITDSGGDIADYDDGWVGIWFNLQTAPSGGEYLIDVRDADGSDRISATFAVSGGQYLIDVTYRSNSIDATVVGSVPIATGIWNYFRLDWHSEHEFHKAFHSYINGMEDGDPTEILNVWGGGNGLTWHFTEDYNNTNGSDAFIGKITMGKQAHTPEIWTVFGEPIHIPKVDKV